MTHAEITQALFNLCLGKEWTLSGDNYADLVWLSDGAAPTLEEIVAEIFLLPAKKAEKEAEVLAAKAAAEAKLAALGLTTDDLKALGLGTN
jgi:hypothetical protein